MFFVFIANGILLPRFAIDMINEHTCGDFIDNDILQRFVATMISVNDMLCHRFALVIVFHITGRLCLHR